MTEIDKKSPPDFPQLHDIGLFYERLHAAVARMNAIRPYALEVLGQVEGYDIFLLFPEEQDPKKLSLLSAGGFHGEEPAGVWGIVEYLETATADELNGVNHSFLPLVNPTGFAAGTRLNVFGENPNRSFVPELIADNSEDIYKNRTEPSVEGKILMAHIDRLATLARDGFVTQHEDDGLNEGFIFLSEDAPQPSPFADIFLACLRERVGIIKDGGADTLIDPKLQNGIWHNDFDATFEGLLTRKGIPRVVTTETPCLKPARARIDCNRDMIRAFAAFRPAE
ncbi:MAG: hypothetical protein EP349_02045 [Alphaproteobacteria bacterium]|nr:MAG: hypothetical protein EP349_02045 [Alphaproteobacteria bacterium]